MRLAALFSGGKDSTYAVYLAERLGYEVPILLTVNPTSEESYYFHYPNVWITRLQAEAMGKVHIMTRSGQKRDDELRSLGDLVDKVLGRVDGLLSGVISSRMQYEIFKELCDKRGLKFVTPLWSRDPMEILEQMLLDDFEIMIVGVAAEGLRKEILGKTIDKMLLRSLRELFERYGVSPVGEGGEMETLVTDAPIFRKRIRVLDYELHWSGFSGYIDIKGVELIEK